jgi:hypothetical protein
MKAQDFLTKITSRKFISMLLGLITTILVTKGMPENQIAQIVAIVGGFGAIVTYIYAEASVDASVNNACIPPEEPTKTE